VNLGEVFLFVLVTAVLLPLVAPRCGARRRARRSLAAVAAEAGPLPGLRSFARGPPPTAVPRMRADRDARRAVRTERSTGDHMTRATVSAESTPPVTIVTGAGSGIGRAVARRLAGAGHAIVLVGRRPQPLEETAAALGSEPAAPEPLVLPADVTEEDGPAIIVERTLDRLGHVDALVNNAGLAPLTPLAEISDEQVRSILAVNFLGPLRLIRRLWPVMTGRGGGTIVNVSSMSVLDPFPGLGVYGAAKAALDGLTRAVVSEGGDAGLLAWSVAPGAVETDMLRGLFTAEDLPTDRTLDPDAVAAVIADCVLGRRSEPPGALIELPSP